MCDNETKIKEIKRGFEDKHHTRMRNTSWHMPRETMQELEDELYQEAVEESSEAYIEFLYICFW
ncbi:MAG: hypothetical protein IKF17_00610 [Clostridia bacterium]|nr:hypothetical protein [Clostridia bacterium]